MKHGLMTKLVVSFSFLMCGVATAQDLSTPKAAALVFAKAMEAGDAAGAKAASICNADGAKFLEVMTDIIKNGRKLEEAAVAKFGDAGKNLGNMESMDMAKNLENSEVKEEGDSATITIKDSPEKPVKLKKVDGAWKVDMITLISEADLARAMPMFTAMNNVYAGTAGEISAGKYPTADAAKQAMGMKLLAAMSAGMVAEQASPATQPTTQP